MLITYINYKSELILQHNSIFMYIYMHFLIDLLLCREWIAKFPVIVRICILHIRKSVYKLTQRIESISNSIMDACLSPYSKMAEFYIVCN